jgi:hypothetical protein
MAKAGTRAANQTRAQKAKAVHQEKSKERANEQQTIKAQYVAARDGDIVQDVLAKAKKFQDYHKKLAQDGVGARRTGHKLVDGSEEVENYFLDKDERVSHLDKAAGLQELVDYLDRMIALPEESQVKK